METAQPQPSLMQQGRAWHAQLSVMPIKPSHTEEGTNPTHKQLVWEKKDPMVIKPRLFLVVRESSKASKEEECRRGIYMCRGCSKNA